MRMYISLAQRKSISGLVVEYIVAIDVTRARFPADASLLSNLECQWLRNDTSNNTIIQHGLLMHVQCASPL